MDVQREDELPWTTRCFLWERYEENQSSRLPVIPREESLNRSPLCQTRSNALEMSQNTARTSFPSSSALQIVVVYIGQLIYC